MEHVYRINSYLNSKFSMQGGKVDSYGTCAQHKF